MRYLTILLLNALCLLAQPDPTPTTPAGFQIKQFLQLTDAQFVTIFNNNQQYARLAAETNRRVFQLRGEIAAETNRPSPDPLELGNRYAEIALVCRFLETEGKRLVERNVAVLTDAQRARLRSLEEAIRLLPVIAEAQTFRLMEGSIPLLTGTRVPGGRLLGPQIGFFGGCPSAWNIFPADGGPTTHGGVTELNRTDISSQ